MIDPTFPETCDVLIDVVRLFSGDIIAFPYCCVKYSGSFGDVKCSPGSATKCPGKSWENVVSAKRLHGEKNFLEGKVCVTTKKRYHIITYKWQIFTISQCIPLLYNPSQSTM